MSELRVGALGRIKAENESADLRSRRSLSEQRFPKSVAEPVVTRSAARLVALTCSDTLAHVGCIALLADVSRTVRGLQPPPSDGDRPLLGQVCRSCSSRSMIERGA